MRRTVEEIHLFENWNRFIFAAELLWTLFESRIFGWKLIYRQQKAFIDVRMFLKKLSSRSLLAEALVGASLQTIVKQNIMGGNFSSKQLDSKWSWKLRKDSMSCLKRAWELKVKRYEKSLTIPEESCQWNLLVLVSRMQEQKRDADSKIECC